MAINPKHFRYELDAETGVATITLDRPERYNALTFDVYKELRHTFEVIGDEPDVRTIVITGAGKAFCSGGDVEDIIGALFSRDFEGLLEFTRITGGLVYAIRRCPRPVIAALNGTVAGAGAVIATACDFRVASEDARIAYLFVKVGLSGADMGVSWLLPRIVGLSEATKLLFTGDFITAAEALRIGLYGEVVAKEQVLERSRELALQLARGPRFALEISKDALNREASMDLAGAIEHEAQIQAVCMQHPDFREAYDAWVAKRKPEFK